MKKKIFKRESDSIFEFLKAIDILKEIKVFEIWKSHINIKYSKTRNCIKMISTVFLFFLKFLAF